MVVYLDNASTTRQHESVTETMTRFMREDFGNPSSLHGLGHAAELAVRDARRQVAGALGCAAEELTFTSGGTEAANLALFGAAKAGKRRGNKIIASAVEHPAVMESCKRLGEMGFEIVTIGVDEKCRLDMDAFRASLDERVILVSVMWVNNETGTIMPVDEIGKMLRGNARAARGDGSSVLSGTVFHTDAVQAFGKIPVAAGAADLISVSGHKIHGPKGCGALYAAGGQRVAPMIYGGGQERRMRSGTENVPAIAGFGAAAEIAVGRRAEIVAGRQAEVAAGKQPDITVGNRVENAAKMSEARRYMLDGIKAEIKDIRINSVEEDSVKDDCVKDDRVKDGRVKDDGVKDDRVDGISGLCSPAILNVSFLGAPGEVLLHALEEDGIYVSTGAACSSNKKGRSPTLTGMGLSDQEIESALRFSFNAAHTVEELDFALAKLKQAVERFRK